MTGNDAPPAPPSTWASLIGAYCHRPHARHELGIEPDTLLTVRSIGRSSATYTYRIDAPAGRAWVARLAVASPNGLSSARQIAAEAGALRAVEGHGIAPGVCFADATLYHLPYGLLVMEYQSGRPLNYQTASDRRSAVRLLAKLHRLPLPGDLPLPVHHTPLQYDLAVARGLIGQLVHTQGPREPIQLLNYLLSIAQAKQDDTELPRGETLVHGSVLPDGWVMPDADAASHISAVPSLPLFSRSSPRLVNWSRAAIDHWTADLCDMLWTLEQALVQEMGRVQPWRDELIDTYLAARPDLNALAARRQIEARQRFVGLRRVAEQVSATGPQLDSAKLKALFGDWLA